MDLQLSAQAGQVCTVVRVAGELDMDTSPQLEDFLQEVVDGGARQVVLDYTDVTFMDSSGLGVLVTWVKTLQNRGGRLCVAAVPRQVRDVLMLSAVDRVVDVYDSVVAAEDEIAS